MCFHNKICFEKHFTVQNLSIRSMRRVPFFAFITPVLLFHFCVLRSVLSSVSVGGLSGTDNRNDILLLTGSSSQTTAANFVANQIVQRHRVRTSEENHRPDEFRGICVAFDGWIEICRTWPSFRFFLVHSDVMICTERYIIMVTILVLLIITV